jgi:hypothetical protein
MDNENAYEQDKQEILRTLAMLADDIKDESFCHHTLFAALDVVAFIREVLICDEQVQEDGIKN